MPSLKSYLIGFLISIALTLLSFYFGFQHLNSEHASYSHEFLRMLFGILAIVQLVVQLVFFLHLGKGSDSSWNLAALFSTAFIVLLLVAGSIWIMNHLNYNMTPSEMNNYLLDKEGINILSENFKIEGDMNMH